MAVSRWQTELEDTLATKSAVILCGDIRGLHLSTPSFSEDLLELLPLKDCLSRILSGIVSEIYFYDPISKIKQISDFSSEGAAETGVAGDHDLTHAGGSDPELDSTSAGRIPSTRSPIDRDLDRIRLALTESTDTCYVIQYADKVTQKSPDTEDANRLILNLEKTIENMPETNRLVLVYLFSDQVPRELYQQNPKVNMIEVPSPDRKDLQILFERYYHLPVHEAERARDVADGLRFMEIDQIVRSLGDDFDTGTFEGAVRQYKFGERQNYWDEVSLDKLDHARDSFEEAIKGQDSAIDKVITVLVRARADIQRKTGGNTRSPRGKLIFAGPTGVGKTLMARTIAQFLFGSPDNVLRFDMSEYAAEFQVARLYGAPPGYVGYESGGTLTNSIKAKPFSVVLFDEIEKAHARVFDIFLQVLEDGRLTDSQGETVFFSESLVIFTSNLGTRTRDIMDNPIDERERLEKLREAGDTNAIRQHFLDSVDSFFQYEISRPELLNRIGWDNISVFDYISTDNAKAIFDSALRKLVREFNSSYANSIPRLQIDMDLEAVRDQLHRQNLYLTEDMGGRHVDNVINSAIRDQLARLVLKAEHDGMEEATINISVDDDNLDFDLA